MVLLVISILVSLGSVAVMWTYMCRVSADRNGWLRLADVYRLDGSFEGSRFGLQSAIFNGFAFTGTLNVGVSRQGLYLRGGPLLRPFHPPLLIPWTKLTAERFERSHSSGYTLRFSGFPDMACELGDACLRRLSEGLDPSWGVEPPWETA